MKIVAITSCPTALHIHIWLRKLEQVAKEMGVDRKERHKAVLVLKCFTMQDIEEADGVIIAADKQVGSVPICW